ncbi:MAG: helix-turn-helix domain-containing protein [Lactobacillales bacterium]|nr:helix-turn-helix domain-containing protein [Lactobacillales bacterium]
MLKAHKMRIYPTAQQKQYLEQSFGCSRWYWNWLLDNWNYNIEMRQVFPNHAWEQDTEKELKSYHTWLKDVDANALQQTRMAFEKAQKMRKTSGFGKPKFKSRRGKNSYKVSTSI